MPLIPSSRLRLPALVALAVVAWVATAPWTVEAASRRAVRGAHAMVVSPEHHATDVGLEVLRSGGNAVDAAKP